MKTTTKIMLALIVLGAGIEALYYNDYKEAYNLALVAIVVFLVWYHEKEIDKRKL